MTTHGRKQACQFCRHRKKKCDGKAPSCSICTKFKVPCFYQAPRTRTADDLQPWVAPPSPKPEYASYTSPSSDGLSWTKPLSTPLDALASIEPPFFSQPGPPNLALALASPHGDAVAGGMLQDATPQWPSATRSTPAMTLPMDPFAFDTSAQPSMWSESGRGTMSSSSGGSVYGVPSPQTSPSPCGQAGQPAIQLPPNFGALLDKFFNDFHALLPCIHADSFRAEMAHGAVDIASDPLPWIIAAMTASSQPAMSNQDPAQIYFEHAKTLMHQCSQTLQHPKHALQAGIWIAFHNYVLARLPQSFVSMGTVAKMASIMGFDRIDAAKGRSAYYPATSDFAEIEERRQTMWALYRLDRYLSSLCGWPLTIDDRFWAVDFPTDCTAFHGAPRRAQPQIFTYKLGHLVSLLEHEPPDPTQQCHQCTINKVSVVLGRIIMHHDHMHSTEDADRLRVEFGTLEHVLNQFYVVCALDANDLLSVPQSGRDSAIFLQSLLQLCSILLYHPTVTPSPHEPQSVGSTNNTCISAIVDRIGYRLGCEVLCTGFGRCLHAMQNIIRTVREICCTSIRSLVNPFMVPVYFLCCRMLVLSWHEQQHQSYKQDVELIVTLLNRCSRSWGPISHKFRLKMLQDLNDDDAWTHKNRKVSDDWLSSLHHGANNEL